MFMDHATDVLAAQNLAMNTDSSLQWVVRDMEVESDKTTAFKMLHLLSKWGPMTHNATDRA